MDEFFKLLVKRMENFYSFTTGGVFGTSGFKKMLTTEATTLTGSSALLAKYDSVSAMFEQNEAAAVTMADLQPLKTYGWVFSEVQAEQIRKWIGVVAASLSRGGGAQSYLEDIDGGSKTAIVLAGDCFEPHSASSSSSAACPATKKAKVAVAKVADAQNNMLRFFVKS
jgi:hypothetical protein